MVALEGADDGRDEGIGDAWWRVEAQEAGDAAGVIRGDLIDGVTELGGTLRLLEKRRAGRGEAQASRGALEKAKA